MKINAWQEKRKINNTDFIILMYDDGKNYECYITDGADPLKYMFGLPKNQQSAKKAIEIALSSAPDYIDDSSEIYSE